MTSRWPSTAETCSHRQTNKYDPTTVVFWRTHPPSFLEKSCVPNDLKHFPKTTNILWCCRLTVDAVQANEQKCRRHVTERQISFSENRKSNEWKIPGIWTAVWEASPATEGYWCHQDDQRQGDGMLEVGSRCDKDKKCRPKRNWQTCRIQTV